MAQNASIKVLYRWQLTNTSSFLVIGLYTGPTSYNNTGTESTSGDSLPASVFGLNAFADTSDAQLQVAPALGPVWKFGDGLLTYEGYFDATSGNYHLRVASTGAEVANATNVSTYTALLAAVGR